MCAFLSRDSDVLKPAQDNTMNSSKRLTMVERARLQAMSSFGNEGLGSLPVKRKDFGMKLKSTTARAETKSGNTRPLTRIQRAKIEANDAFKNVKLGQMVENPNKRKVQDTDQNENSKNQRHFAVTRLQRAKQEAEKAFENISLDKIPKKKSKLEKEKMVRKGLEGNKHSRPTTKFSKGCRIQNPLPQSNPPLQSSKASQLLRGIIKPDVRSVETNTNKRLTRSQSAEMEVLKCFEEVETSNENSHFKEKSAIELSEQLLDRGKKGIDNAEVAMKTPHAILSNTAPIHHKKNNINSAVDQNNGCKTQTRLERAKLEALHSFVGQEFSDVCKQSSRIVAKHLRPKKDKSCNTENQNLSHKLICASEFHNKPTHEESLQNHSALFSRSETPDKAIQTHEQLKSTQHQLSKKPRVDVYSSILEENFKDQSSLLEISRRVVRTAIQLETPESSPVCTPTS